MRGINDILDQRNTMPSPKQHPNAPQMPDRRTSPPVTLVTTTIKTDAEAAADRIMAEAQAKANAIRAKQAALDEESRQLAETEQEKQAQIARAQAQEAALEGVQTAEPHIINAILGYKERATNWQEKTNAIIEALRNVATEQHQVREQYRVMLAAIGRDIAKNGWEAAWASETAMLAWVYDLCVKNYYPTGWQLNMTDPERRFYQVQPHGISPQQAYSSIAAGVKVGRQMYAEQVRAAQKAATEAVQEDSPPDSQSGTEDNESGADN